MDVTEMRMLRWICGKTKKDKIRNQRFREQLGVTTIGDKIRETRFRWFGHIQCRLATTLVRKSLAMKGRWPTKGKG